MEEKDLIIELNTKRGNLCRELMELCRKKPTTPFCKVPGARKKAKEVDDFDAYVLSYYHYKWNPRTYTYEEETK